MPGTDFYLRATDYSRQQAQAATRAAAQTAPDADATTKEDTKGFGFDDFLDIINPLQHIPVVSTVYRHLTGDKIGTAEKIAGDGLYGGLTGLLCSLGDAAFAELTGKNVGDTVYAYLFGEDDAPIETNRAIAQNAPPPPASTNTASTGQAIAAYRASGRLLEAY